MAVDVLLGLQWGDEGKGKVVDYLARKYDIVARFQGGPNAGHTLEFDGIKHVLHQIPSGIFHKEIKNVIGNGVVLDPIKFFEEAKELLPYNIKVQDNLVVSNRAQLIIPTHKLLDHAQELAKGDNKIGSTLKGIGPTYQDKIGRSGIRVGDLLLPDFKEKYEALKKEHMIMLDFFKYDCDNITIGKLSTSLAELEEQFFTASEFMKNLDIKDTAYFINNALKEGKAVLAEGAQGSLLDIDYGTYPYVTSSNTTVAGVCSGLGVAPSKIGEVLGIFKAYCTRVGSGPFPTELLNETGDKLMKVGNEFGSTTGRARRCGWLDLPALNYSIMINGVTSLLMMKIDVLNGFETIDICTGYEQTDGSVKAEFPYDIERENMKPHYNSFKGWQSSLDNIKTSEIPTPMTDYINFIQKETGVPIDLVSTGPKREEVLDMSM
ncbi:MAG: adenylosuccinate synthase [Cyclobacteriaceae bacterium]